MSQVVANEKPDEPLLSAFQQSLGTYLRAGYPILYLVTAEEDRAVEQIAGLLAEFLRQGRFDDIFFVGLPGEEERRSIFRIHLARRKRPWEDFALAELVQATAGFSGAEIEQVVIGGLFRAFEAQRELETGDMLQAAQETHPLSKSRAREIAQLTAWASRNAKQASRT